MLKLQKNVRNVMQNYNELFLDSVALSKKLGLDDVNVPLE
jgi:hypothetical protein